MSKTNCRSFTAILSTASISIFLLGLSTSFAQAASRDINPPAKLAPIELAYYRAGAVVRTPVLGRNPVVRTPVLGPNPVVNTPVLGPNPVVVRPVIR